MREGVVVPHTHWDREWYQPFQSFRRRLVGMVDDLIDVLESDPSFAYFFFDGQTIVLDDYLEVKPHMRERLAALIRSGRIGVGPWYNMPDEFLVSGEALVRNLMKGVRTADSLGAVPVRCGYVCDLFGHNSQFPQVLTGFDIHSAVIARGFADNSTPAELYWKSPDGSRVLAAKLDAERSYSDFYFAIRWPFEGRDYNEDELVERMERHLAHKSALQASGVYLFLEGVDHIEVEPKLPWILDVLNSRIDDITFRIGSVEEYFEALDRSAEGQRDGPGFPIIEGEQIEPGRQGVNNQVLSNVWSSRVDLKRRNDECQTILELWAEPLSVWQAWLHLGSSVYPADFLRLAWEYLLKNHPHDSICGCSVGQVHRDMHYRFDQCGIIAEDIVEQALTDLVDDIDTAPLPGDRSVTLYNNSDNDDEQVVVFELGFADSESTRNIALYDCTGAELPYQRLSVRQEIKKRHTKRRLIQFVPLRFVQVAARLRIPARGYTTVAYENREPERMSHGDYTLKEWVSPIRYPGSMRVGDTSFDNGVLLVSIDNAGHLEVIRKDTERRFVGLLGIEDGGENGDGWNYRPPEHDTIVTNGSASATVSIAQDGPYFAALHVRFDLLVPEQIADDGKSRSAERTAMTIEHEISLRSGSPRIDVTTTVHNSVRDHIVSLLFPTDLETNTFATDTPFDIVERSFDRPDRSDYVEPDTGAVPSQGFMRIADSRDGIAVFSRGIYEYKAKGDSRRTLALTLMRCFAKEVGTHGGSDGQLQGRQTFRYALYFFTPDTRREIAEYQAFKTGVQQWWSLHHNGTQRPEAQIYRHSNFEVVITALKRAEDLADAWIMRLVNTTEGTQRDSLDLPQVPRSVEIVNLNEQPSGPGTVDDGLGEGATTVAVDGSTVRLEIPAKKIVTLKIIL